MIERLRLRFFVLSHALSELSVVGAYGMVCLDWIGLDALTGIGVLCVDLMLIIGRPESMVIIT